MSAITQLEEASAILTLIMMTDELPHELKEETARAARVAWILVEEALTELRKDAIAVTKRAS